MTKKFELLAKLSIEMSQTIKQIVEYEKQNKSTKGLIKKLKGIEKKLSNI